MPSTSVGRSPASPSALRMASTAMARVVRPDLWEYSVSPTPAMQYLSRRLFIDRSPYSRRPIIAHVRGAAQAAQKGQLLGGEEGGHEPYAAYGECPADEPTTQMAFFSGLLSLAVVFGKGFGQELGRVGG